MCPVSRTKSRILPQNEARRVTGDPLIFCSGAPRTFEEPLKLRTYSSKTAPDPWVGPDPQSQSDTAAKLTILRLMQGWHVSCFGNPHKEHYPMTDMIAHTRQAQDLRAKAVSGPFQSSASDGPEFPSEGPDSGVRLRPQMSDAQLVELYSPLVRQIAGGFQRKLPRNVLRDDLVAAGMSGLWDAVRRQTEAPGERFEYYVRVRIRGAILDELRAQDWLPRRARALAQEAQENGDHARAVAPAVVRFDDVSEWEQSRCLSTADDTNSEIALENKMTHASLTRAVEQLPQRERHIVSAHYFRGVKFKDLGLELGVSEPRISQLHSRAMERLKVLMAEAA